MSKLIIEGPSKLSGKVTISGSKNAALPIISATILAKGKFKISNVPEIADIKNLISILEELGAKSKLHKNILEIDTTNVDSIEPDPKKVRNIRASILLAGPLLARFKKVKLAHPGGCFIGARPVGVHFNAFKSLGAEIASTKEHYEITANELKANRVVLDEISVTGTENVIMAAVLAKGTTEIRLAATEPHVVDLCHFLNKMGAKISGIGTHTLVIEGVNELDPTDYEITYDQIEAGTFALAAAASRSEVIIDGFIINDHDILLKKFDEVNVNYEILSENSIKILKSTSFNPANIRTDIYPGFPTDLQAPFAVFLTQAEGTSEIYETLFEGRLNYINELNKMGANCIIRNSHQASITGPTPLYGTTIQTLDLRAGATLIIAALIAEGTSIVENAQIIDRGYENIEEKLISLGAKISRISDEVEKNGKIC